MSLVSIEPQRLYHRIAGQLRGLILRGEYAPGTRLPPERDLALQLGVSRPSVREALIALEVEGYVDIRIGSGIYARTPVTPGVGAMLAHADGPLELIRARPDRTRSRGAGGGQHQARATRWRGRSDCADGNRCPRRPHPHGG